MNDVDTRLPAGFEALQPFVAAWACDTTAARVQRRLDSTAPERLAFYEAARPLVPAALALLDPVGLASLDPAQRKLMNLALAFCHVALAVEIQGQAEPQQALARRHMHIQRSVADRDG